MQPIYLLAGPIQKVYDYADLDWTHPVGKVGCVILSEYYNKI